MIRPEQILYKFVVVMEFWEKSQYKKWYLSHRRFSFTSRHIIEMYEEDKQIPDSIFKPFLKSLDCHSKGEEKRIFNNIPVPETLFDDHSHIIPTKKYTNEEKYNLCKSLLIHMKNEEEILRSYIENLYRTNNISERSYAGGSRQGRRPPHGTQPELNATDPAAKITEHREKGEQKAVRV